MTVTDTTLEQLALCWVAADKTGAVDPVALDVSQPLPFADAFLIVTGSSERGVSAISREIERAMNEADYSTLRREGREGGRWALLDFGDLVVHVFHEEDRTFYGLERLWNDCPVVPIPRNVDTSTA